MRSGVGDAASKWRLYRNGLIVLAVVLVVLTDAARADPPLVTTRSSNGQYLLHVRFADRAARSVNRAEVARLRASLLGARLVIGVDRLDYSKGLDNRFRAFDLALERDPALKRTVRLLQIAVLSRSGIRSTNSASPSSSRKRAIVGS